MAPPKEPFTLYHNYWSSCSLMVRLALELGKQNPNVPEVPVVLKAIDIQHGGQLEESFIADVNRMGTVRQIVTSQYSK
jgi:glutathione S-transferase